jgi:hypothetical protein
MTIFPLNNLINEYQNIVPKNVFLLKFFVVLYDNVGFNLV